MIFLSSLPLAAVTLLELFLLLFLSLRMFFNFGWFLASLEEKDVLEKAKVAAAAAAAAAVLATAVLFPKKYPPISSCLSCFALVT